MAQQSDENATVPHSNNIEESPTQSDTYPYRQDAPEGAGTNDIDSLLRGRRRDELTRTSPEAIEQNTKAERPVTWSYLPRKEQLTLIVLTRFSEPLVQTSLRSYLFYQLQWFDPSLSDAIIAGQAGILTASFTAAQFTTALLWGRAADDARVGRKSVLMIGLIGTMISCIGFGFSTTFWQALVFRILGGITNGNIGVMRTMISEIIKEKKYQPRAFLLLPMTWNIGIIFGPILGGVLSDPAGSYPNIFGKVTFFIKYPYATPNLISGILMGCAALAAWLGLDETLDCLRDDGPDLGVRTRRRLISLLRGRSFGRPTSTAAYLPLPSTPRGSFDSAPDLEPSPVQVQSSSGNISPTPRPKTTPPRRLPFRRIFIPNVNLTLLAQFLLALHLGSFNSLWFTFLSTPVASDTPIQLPFRFTGGLGLQPSTIGLATAILGVIGIALQLLVYPRVSSRLGTLQSWRWSLLCFPVAYICAPFLTVVLRLFDGTASSSSRDTLSTRYEAVSSTLISDSDAVITRTGIPDQDGVPGHGLNIMTWLAIATVLSVQVLGRTFAIPAQTILVNNCSPHPSVLGTVHGVGQSVSSAARTLGPIVGGVVYGAGLRAGCVGLIWWVLAAVAVLGVGVSLVVREGQGVEIILDEEEEDG